MLFSAAILQSDGEPGIYHTLYSYDSSASTFEPLLISSYPGQETNPRDLTVIGNYAYFTAKNDVDGLRYLWKTDGTQSGTELVSSNLTFFQLDCGLNKFNCNSFISMNNKIYFWASHNDYGYELMHDQHDFTSITYEY